MDGITSRDLAIERIIGAPPAAVYRAWTDPELLKRWFAPAPLTVPVAELDVRAGGGSLIVMRAPDGTEMPMRGVYLEVIPDAKLVMTDAYTAGWEPSAKPFMTVICTFEPVAEGTRYVARVRHWSEADRAAHEAMGFHRGWALCADQLAALIS